MEFDDRKERYFEKSRDEHADLGSLDFSHIPLVILREHFPDDFACICHYASFALIRDPFERFASSLHEYLHWSYALKLADLSPQQTTKFSAEAIGRLQVYSDGAPVTDSELIHFSRQTDFIEIDGKPIVSCLFAIEDLDAMMASIGKLIGQPIAYRPINQRIRYHPESLQLASEAVQRALRATLSQNLLRPILNFSRKVMMKSGFVKLEKRIPFDTQFGDETKAFVQEFYQRDIDLRHRIISTVAD